MACAGPSSHCLYPKGCSRFSMLQTRLGLTHGSSRQGWRRLCCREGKKYRVEGGFKAGGEALRGVPVPISLPADCSVLEHCPIPPARRPPSSPRTWYVSRSVPPPPKAHCLAGPQHVADPPKVSASAAQKAAKCGISVFRLLPISAFCWCL